MTHDPKSFFHLARSIRLQSAEFDVLKQNLIIAVRNGNDTRLQLGMQRNDFLKTAQRLSLTTGERLQVLAGIRAEMENLSVLQNPFHSFLTLCSRCLAAVMIFLLCGAGVSYAAESALPGDALYTVKVNFTEPILLRLNASTEAKARVVARLAGRRLEEVERLAEKSQLTAEHVTTVQERLKSHIIALESDLRELATLDHQTSGSIAIDTVAEFEAHENLLEEIHNHQGGSNIQKLIRETRKGRALAERVTVSAKIENLAEVMREKAEAEIRKTKSNKSWQKRSDENMVLADAISNAEMDLKVSVEEGTAADMKIKKAASALKKAKKAKFMLLLPERTLLKRLSPQNTRTEPDHKPTEETDDSENLQSSSTVSTSAAAATSVQENILDLPEEATKKIPSL